jgi:hypothetical protein
MNSLLLPMDESHLQPKEIPIFNDKTASEYKVT